MRDEDDDDDRFEVGAVVYVRHTDKSMLVAPDGENEHIDGETWIPHAHVHDDSEVYCSRDLNSRTEQKMVVVGKEGTLIVSAWLAKERGWSE